jgi:hypothetical protein
VIKLLVEPKHILNGPSGPISSFKDGDSNNATETVESFGDEWHRFSSFEDR